MQLKIMAKKVSQVESQRSKLSNAFLFHVFICYRAWDIKSLVGFDKFWQIFLETLRFWEGVYRKGLF